MPVCDHFVTWHLKLLDDLPGKGVDQPGLAAGQLVGVLDGTRGEPLPGIRGVLAVEFGDFLGREIAQPQ